MEYIPYLKIGTKSKLLKGEEQQSPALVAPEIGFLEDNFSMDGGREKRDGFRIILIRST